MDYRKGSIRRIFAVRIDHGDDILSELSGLAIKEDIRSAFFIMIGAVGSADLVTGPKEKVVPPMTVWSSFDDAREILGAGNIFWENDAPKIHLHACTGNSKNMVMGCIRKKAEVFMVVEVFIIEMDILAERIFNETMGVSPIIFS
jgi:predicted DNA-binding protein with PD1-like motif